MSIANLHSILNRPWYIEQNYAQGHLPLVLGMLSGNSVLTNKEEHEKPVLVHHLDDKGMAVSAGSAKTTTVAVLSIKNPIVKHDQFCGPQGTKSMMRELDSLKGNDNVAGVVLDIDSGGGQAYGTPEFYDYLMNYPKPIVSYTDGLMCSAAYYIGSASSHIVTNSRAEAIGSIGAYSQLLDLDGYYEKQGLKVHTMYATKSTEKNKAYREAMKGEEFYGAYIREELDPLVDSFINDMKTARPSIDEAVFKGATYDGPKAVEMGLADELGNIQTAIDKVFELSNTKKSNSNNMSKEYKNIEGAIGAEFAEGATENGLLLTEAEADAVENSLTTSAEQLTEAQNTVSQLQTAADNAVTANTAIVAQANEVLELSGDDAVTDVAGAIAAYQAKINELGAEPGAGHTTKVENEEEDSAHPYMNLNTPFYNKTKSLLN